MSHVKRLVCGDLNGIWVAEETLGEVVAANADLVGVWIPLLKPALVTELLVIDGANGDHGLVVRTTAGLEWDNAWPIRTRYGGRIATGTVAPRFRWCRTVARSRGSGRSWRLDGDPT
ncbi:hypothetical protein PG996_015255 [Apiospora saccharicola]|uniref:Uncharacterized protein n=1 Tax=Apiospora saccharicola TaxID=335842 RepID=A0ABR1TKK7_9PEZI